MEDIRCDFVKDLIELMQTYDVSIKPFEEEDELSIYIQVDELGLELSEITIDLLKELLEEIR